MTAILWAIGIIVLDQFVKYWVVTHMLLGASIPIIADIFHITYILNPGAAFGILENQRYFFIAIALVMIIFVLYLYPRIPRQFCLLRMGVILLVGGAAGNLIDRIRTGLVVDFIDFRIWPVFNIADVSIVIGVSIIIYSMLRTPPRT